MGEISAQAVKALREATGAGMMECKKALEETDGDSAKATELLRKRGLAAAKKREGRVAAEGKVESYIHMGGRIGVLVEINCETDFVARGEDFQNFARDIAMHVCASEPQYVAKEDVPEATVAKETEIARAQTIQDPKNAGKPDHVIDKIVQGKLEKFYGDTCLLEQPFVRDQTISVGDLLRSMVAKTGENIRIRRFTRYKLGEGIEKRTSDLAAEVAAALQQ